MILDVKLIRKITARKKTGLNCDLKDAASSSVRAMLKCFSICLSYGPGLMYSLHAKVKS